jgi:hypothetical protein
MRPLSQRMYGSRGENVDNRPLGKPKLQRVLKLSRSATCRPCFLSSVSRRRRKSSASSTSAPQRAGSFMANSRPRDCFRPVMTRPLGATEWWRRFRIGLRATRQKRAVACPRVLIRSCRRRRARRIACAAQSRVLAGLTNGTPSPLREWDVAHVDFSAARSVLSSPRGVYRGFEPRCQGS